MSPTLPPPRLYNPPTDTSLLSSIAHLHESCITIDHTLATFLPPLSHAKILASWESWSEQVSAGSRVIILQLTGEEGVVAGVVSLSMPDSETGRHRSEVGRLLVSPDFRKKGLARELMRVLEDVARERDRWMVVRDHNFSICWLQATDFRFNSFLTQQLAVEQSLCTRSWDTRKSVLYPLTVSVQRMVNYWTRCSFIKM
jgi:GNAT superfamily N-acetyltransferase